MQGANTISLSIFLKYNILFNRPFFANNSTQRFPIFYREHAQPAPKPILYQPHNPIFIDLLDSIFKINKYFIFLNIIFKYFIIINMIFYKV